MRYILLFFLVTNTLHAQKAIVESYFDKYYDVNTINKDSGFYYISKAYQLSKKSNLDSLASRSAYNIGRIYFYQSDFEKAKHFTKLAINHAEKVNFLKLKIMSYMQLGTIERENSNYNKALSYYINGLKINKKHIDIDLEIEINNNIAILYTLQKDSVKALNYYKSNQINVQKTDNLSLKIIYYNSLGGFLIHKSPIEAEKYFLKAYQLAKEIKDVYELYNLAINFSSLYLNKNYNKPAKSLQYLKEAEQLLEEINDESLNFYLYFNYGGYYRQINDFENAIFYYNKALLSKNIPIYQKADLYKSLTNIYQLKNNFKDAYFFKQKYHELNDSLLSLEHKKQFSEIETMYEVEKKNARINILTKEKTIQENNKIIILFIGISLILFMVIVFMIFYFRIKNISFKNEQEKINLIKQQEIEHIKGVIEGQNEERNRISKDLHDGVATTLAHVKRKINEYNSNQDKELDKIEYTVTQIYNDIRTISHNLSNKLIFEKTLDELLYILQYEVQNKENFNMSITIFPEKKMDFLNYNLKENIYRIIQELINNIIKHANASEVYINCTYALDNLNIIIEDNGKNSFNYNSKKLGIGLINVKDRLSIINGKMERDTNKYGATLIIDIPI